MAGPGSNLPGSKFARSRPSGPRGPCCRQGGLLTRHRAPNLRPPRLNLLTRRRTGLGSRTIRHEPESYFCDVFSGSRIGATRFTSCAHVGLIRQDEKALSVVTGAPSEAWTFFSLKQLPCRPEFSYHLGSPRSFRQHSRRRFSNSTPLFLCLCAADIRDGRAGQKRHSPIQTTIAALLCGQVGTSLHEVVFRLLVDPADGRPLFVETEHANRQSPSSAEF